MKKWLRTISVTTMAAMLITGCGTGGETEPPAAEETPAAEEATDFTVGMVTDVGGIDDKSFNQSAWEGLTAFGQEYGLEEGTGYRYVQSGSLADFEPNLRNLVREDVNLTFGIGFLMEDAVRTIANQVTDANLAIVDAVVASEDGQPLPNVANITFKEHEGSFLVGVVSGIQTKTNQVGFIG